ncbi:hypothetical protein [Streptomyces sp. NPDC002994]|uniref:hypothetical protein n=1 Tax=Streptomyces sp. NPDC002994 TaxID=3154441 RepID=UPI0033A66432
MGALLALAAALAEAVRSTDVMWGALSGAGSGLAMQFLNRGLSRGAMSIVIPVSAVTGVSASPCRPCGSSPAAGSALAATKAAGHRPGRRRWTA